MSTSDKLVIAGRAFGSRLLTGTGKFDTFETMRDALAASGSEIVTVAVRRVDFDAGDEDITAFFPEHMLVLPNTSGAATAEEAVRSARLARAGGLPDWVKLEVIPDSRYLLPDPVETLRAAEILVEDGFTVLPYVLPDPVLQKKLEEVGCAMVMPLASPIGSGLGLLNPYGIRTIKRRLSVPVIVDAGVGTASDACITMEQGVDGILMNTAIAEARDPVGMARAMRWAVDAGRAAYLAGRMPRREVAVPSTTDRGKLS
jgi:thiazole synthase